MNSHGNNCFLIRESVRRESELTLSLKYESNIQHFMIKRGVGWVEVDGTFKQFYTIPDLVEYYRENSLTLKPKDQLSTPCPRLLDTSQLKLKSVSLLVALHLYLYNWNKYKRQSAQACS